MIDRAVRSYGLLQFYAISSVVLIKSSFPRPVVCVINIFVMNRKIEFLTVIFETSDLMYVYKYISPILLNYFPI
jgi:hypothetical protein